MGTKKENSLQCPRVPLRLPFQEQLVLYDLLLTLVESPFGNI